MHFDGLLSVLYRLEPGGARVFESTEEPQAALDDFDDLILLYFLACMDQVVNLEDKSSALA